MRICLTFPLRWWIVASTGCMYHQHFEEAFLTCMILSDIKRGILHIRHKSHNIWKEHPNDWRLDLTTSICFRSTHRGKEELIDPYSGLFARISRIFEHFEARRWLTVYQPDTHPVTVDLHRMQLRWYVNTDKLLQSSHLFSELDPYQVSL